jgi:photosystem II stability/assembly factor-like uncharacterized protein
MNAIANWTWIATNAPVATSRTDDIWFFDDSNGWLLNSNGQVCQTTDGGESWSQKLFVAPGPPTFPYLRCMGWPSRNVGWIGAVTSGEMNYLDILLNKTEDGGKTWRAMKNMPQGSPAGICGMYAVTESLMYGAGTNDPNLPGTGVVKTSDSGANWQFIDLSHLADNLIDCYFSDQNTGWVVGGKFDPSCPTPPPGTPYSQYAKLKPVVLKTIDGGQTWVNKTVGVQGFECGEWGWKIQWLDAMHGFVSLENFTAAAILTTVDGGETWVRRPVADATGKPINLDLEGVGFITPDSGWAGGWGDNFEGLKNSFTMDGGRTWVAEDNTPSNPASDPRTRINRYRFLGSPPTLGYCSGHTVYKRGTKAQAVALASGPRRAHPAGLSLSHRSFATARSVEISYTLDTDADSVFVGIWNHFAFHVRTLVAGGAQSAGRHSTVWDGTDKNGNPLPGGTFICRISVNGAVGESQTINLPG